MKYTYVIFFLLSLAFGVNSYAQQSEGWNLTPVEVLNTAGDEYSPRIEEHGLLYSRNPVAGDPNIGLRTELMFSTFRQNGLHEGRLFSAELSTPLHESSACLGPNEDFVIFSRNSPAKKNATNYLYLSKIGVHDFQKAEELPFNDSRFNTTHPAIDRSGKRLLFASDRPGGFGGFDLYYVEFKEGGWSKPMNLGEEVNSKSDDIFPYWSENNKITFSSNRSGGYGGLDLYLLDASQSEWSRVKHLGKPFSSEGDDQGLTWSLAAGKGFLSSNREGGKGGDDIYSFTFSEKAPISWMAPDVQRDRLVILNVDQEVVARLDEVNTWQGTLNSYPNAKQLDHQVLAQRLCGTYIDGGLNAPDSIIMKGTRVEIKRSDILRSLDKASVRKSKAEADDIVYTSDQSGGVCMPKLTEKQSWIIEKQGFAPRAIELDPSVPFVAIDLTPDYQADTIILRNRISANRRISSSLSDEVVNSVACMRKGSGYQLIKMKMDLVSTQTPSAARAEVARLVETVKNEVQVHSKAKIVSSGTNVFTDEGAREQQRMAVDAEAFVEYKILFRRISVPSGIGLNVD